MPVPLPWNYKEPIRIFEAFYSEADRETGWGKHNRYLYAAGLPPVLVTRDPGIIKAIQANTGDKPGQFDRDTSPTAGIARATGEDSLLYANGSIWRRQKSMVAKPFSRSNLFQPQKFHGFEETFRVLKVHGHAAVYFNDAGWHMGIIFAMRTGICAPTKKCKGDTRHTLT